jgi:hypothetical protein
MFYSDFDSLLLRATFFKLHLQNTYQLKKSYEQ